MDFGCSALKHSSEDLRSCREGNRVFSKPFLSAWTLWSCYSCLSCRANAEMQQQYVLSAHRFYPCCGESWSILCARSGILHVPVSCEVSFEVGKILSVICQSWQHKQVKAEAVKALKLLVKQRNSHWDGSLSPKVSFASNQLGNLWAVKTEHFSPPLREQSRIRVS